MLDLDDSDSSSDDETDGTVIESYDPTEDMGAGGGGGGGEVVTSTIKYMDVT